MICYLIFSVLIAAAAFTVRRRSLLRLTGAAFYAVQAAFAVRWRYFLFCCRFSCIL